MSDDRVAATAEVVEHQVTVVKSPYFSFGWTWIAICSCKKYQSSKQCAPGLAESAARDHVAAKLGAEFNVQQFYRDIVYRDWTPRDEYI